MTEFWDSKYNSDQYMYGLQPNVFLKEYLEKTPPGKILLPGDGEGRNAVFAAKLGWEVTSFDSSKSAKDKALRMAKEYNVQITYINADVEKFSPDSKFDLISIIYLHLPPGIRHTFHLNLFRYLNPEGKILLECFSKLQYANNSGGPKNMQLLYSLKDIQNDFKDYNVEFLEQAEIELDEGELHQGKANVIRLIASLS
ncbi:MAG TPA: SAM-dependent methyltransferase [Bacteroidales bacterium]|nr:SAM-dependent methyltransferase [Bacteroidales bacterium]